MPHPESLGAIACRCVVSGQLPVGFVSHAGGDWQFYCSDRNHDFSDPEAMKRDLALIHVLHLVLRDPTLDEVSDLPVDMGAERVSPGAPWQRFEDRDEDDDGGRD